MKCIEPTASRSRGYGGSHDVTTSLVVFDECEKYEDVGLFVGLFVDLFVSVFVYFCICLFLYLFVCLWLRLCFCFRPSSLI